MTPFRRAVRCWILIAFFAAAPGRAQLPEPLRPAARIVITRVAVVSVANQKILDNRDVVIEGGRITAIRPAGAGSADGAPRIDGSGLHLLPGLINMHAHLRDSSTLLRLLAHGVTTVRSMNGHPGILRLREAIAGGLIPGPHLVTAGPFVSEHEESDWSQHLSSPEHARQVVAEQAAAGYDLIKIVNLSDDAIRGALFDAARAAGIPVAGHNPDWEAGLEAIAGYRMASLEHLDEFYRELLGGNGDRGRIPEIVDALKSAGIAVTAMILPALEMSRLRVEGMAYMTPSKRATILDQAGFSALNRTLTWAREVESSPPEERQGIDEAFLLDLLKALADARVPLLIGTEANPRNAPVGEGMHRELALFEKAGIGRWQILRSATAEAARVLGRAQTGAVEVGSAADLLLVDGNPLDDLGNLKNVRGVLVGGVWYGPEDLDRLRRMM